MKPKYVSNKWAREIRAEEKRREEFETKKWDREIRAEERRRHRDDKKQRKDEEKQQLKEHRLQRDLEEARGWRGSKRLGQIRNRLRKKLEEGRPRAQVIRSAHQGAAVDYKISNNVVISPLDSTGGNLN